MVRRSSGEIAGAIFAVQSRRDSTRRMVRGVWSDKCRMFLYRKVANYHLADFNAPDDPALVRMKRRIFTANGTVNGYSVRGISTGYSYVERVIHTGSSGVKKNSGLLGYG